VIVPMKEVTIVAARSDQARTLAALQDAGVVHLAEAPHAGDDAVEVMRARLGVVRHAASVLEHLTPPEGAADRRRAAGRVAPQRAAPQSAARSPEELVAEVERLAERLDDLRATHTELERERERLAPFGAFDPSAVRRLRAQGVGVRLAHPLARKPLPEVKDAVWVELAPPRRHRTLVLVGPTDVVEGADVPDEVALPPGSPARVGDEIVDVERALASTRERLAALCDQRTAIDGWLRRTEEALRFEEARAAMETVGAVTILRGFVPEDQVTRVQALAQAHGWGLWVTDVANPSEAPTLIRHPRWARAIAPLFSFLGVVPAYGQVDISVPFLIFFSLFFAMIVGDAGYGALFLLLTEIGARRATRVPRRIVTLMRLLSLATIAWGVASGNYFGIAVVPGALAWLHLDWLASERNVIALSFTIGAVHLSVAHLWNVFRFLNSTRALAEVGWVATTWTMYFLARQLVLGETFPPGAWLLFGFGVALIIAFTTPWSRLRGEWFRHAMLPLTLVSSFVDVVSYVRLFAVGAATFAVASAFNDLAAGVGLGGPLGGALTALVLFFGHALNVLLAAMGVLVHGVRLNTLEFAGHLGLTWTGHPYRPFARSTPTGSADSDGPAGAGGPRAAGRSEGDPSWTPR
jgi:V/A-type H+/Na+-transporting ATPase subunit I